MGKVVKTRKQNKSSHICEYCDKKFVASSDLERHRRVHTGKRPFSCTLCAYSAARTTQLQNHISRHLQEKLYKCEEPGCNYSCVGNSDLKRHQLLHTQEKKFSCSLCSYKTGRKHHLTLHMTTHEENPVKPFRCTSCPFQTTQSAYLKSHMLQIHSTERKFKCPHNGCKFAGKTKTNLNSHLVSHGEKTLVCPHPSCEFKTNRKAFLHRHMQIHGSEKKYKCRICEYASHTSGDLTEHMRTHTKEAPYKCQSEGCKYAGKTSTALTQHVRAVHEKCRPFKCSFCPFAATQKNKLNRHQIRKHQTPDPEPNL